MPGNTMCFDGQFCSYTVHIFVGGAEEFTLMDNMALDSVTALKCLPFVTDKLIIINDID